MIIFALIYATSYAVRASAAVPDISGTWSGTYVNVGVEDYSNVFTILQNGDQFSGNASFAITHSDYAPQDVGKSFIYSLTGTIDENGKIHITGNILSGPPEIVSRAGIINMDWQLSQDGNTISFNGNDEYGNLINVLLNRTATLTTSPTIQPTSPISVSSSLPLNVLLGLLIAAIIGISIRAAFVLQKRNAAGGLPLPPPQPSPVQETPSLAKQVQKKPTGAYSSATIGGIFATIFSLMGLLFAFLTATSESNVYMMGYPGGSSQGIALFGGIGGLGLISAIIILVSAKKLISNPLRHVQCGVLIVVFSIVGSSVMFMYPPEGRFIGIIVFFVSGLTSLVGGIEAIIFKPQVLVVDDQSSNPD